MSPNAALRPLYQEWILPNLVYVGGASELKYWMQLKGMFDNYSVALPIFHLRKSNILIPAKRVESLSDHMITELFNSKENLGKQNSEEFNVLTEVLAHKHEVIKNAISDYNALIKETFSGFSLDGKFNKIETKMLEMRKLVEDKLSIKLKQDSDINRLFRIKDMYFNEELIQERESHFIVHLDMILLLKATPIFQFGLRKFAKISIIIR